MPLWGVWKYEPGPDGRITKVPYNPKTGARARPNTPATFGTRAQAERARASGNYSGLCYVVDASVGITAGDLDHVVSEADAFNEAALPPAVRRIIRIANTDTTWSPSGTGIHFIFGTTVDGYMNRNGGRMICHAEAYNRVRFMTHTGRRIPGTPVTFNDDPDDLIAWYEALEFRKREAEQPAPPRPHTAGAVDDRDLIARLERDAKAGPLLAGNMAGYPSPSEARGALAYKAIFYGADDPEQIVSTILRAGLFRAGTPERERERKARRDAEGALTRYTGERYDPDYRNTPHLTIVPNTNTDALSCPDVRAELAEARQSIIVLQDRVRVADQRRVAAEERADRLSFERSKVMEVLRATDLNPGQKLTHFADVLDLGGRIANGEKPTAAGFRSPAYNTALMTGQKVASVRRHRNELAERGIYTKTNVRETSMKDAVDPETGEIMAATGTRDVTHIVVPENNVTHLITRATTYQNPAGEKRGGRRVTCTKHPEAGTTTTLVTTCDECGDVLDRRTTRHEPEVSGANFACEPPVNNTVLNRDIFALETVAATDSAPDHSSGSNFAAEQRRPTGQQSRLSPPAGLPPGWEDDHRAMYGRLYRGDGAA